MKTPTVIVTLALALLAAPLAAEAQTAIRIGASLSQSGVYAALGQNKLRGYQLVVAVKTATALGLTIPQSVLLGRTR
jgi:hypothetical protein